MTMLEIEAACNGEIISMLKAGYNGREAADAGRLKYWRLMKARAASLPIKTGTRKPVDENLLAIKNILMEA